MLSEKFHSSDPAKRNSALVTKQVLSAGERRMPRKIRQLKADLQRAGFVQIPSRGKGSHTVWEHPLVADDLTLSGHDGDDAKPYQEGDVRRFIDRARRAEQEEQ